MAYNWFRVTGINLSNSMTPLFLYILLNAVYLKARYYIRSLAFLNLYSSIDFVLTCLVTRPLLANSTCAVNLLEESCTLVLQHGALICTESTSFCDHNFGNQEHNLGIVA